MPELPEVETTVKSLNILIGLKVYKLKETPPSIKKFKNTLKSPSGEPDVGSGNFTVKNHE